MCSIRRSCFRCPSVKSAGVIARVRLTASRYARLARWASRLASASSRNTWRRCSCRPSIGLSSRLACEPMSDNTRTVHAQRGPLVLIQVASRPRSRISSAQKHWSCNWTSAAHGLRSARLIEPKGLSHYARRIAITSSITYVKKLLQLLLLTSVRVSVLPGLPMV